MIHQIDSDMPTFKHLQFRQGLNILLADKSPGATDKQTRNGAGKSSLTELIHFLLGARPDIMFTRALRQYSFRMELDLGEGPRQVERSGKAPETIIVQGTNTEDWPIKENMQSLFGELDGPVSLSNNEWRIVLGKLMFGLSEKTQSAKFAPTFRSLFPYFVRRQSEGGFLSPIIYDKRQPVWNQQVSISCLLGLDWTIPQQWQYVRDREKSLSELKKAAQEGALDGFIGNTAELRTQLMLAENRFFELKGHLASYQILPEYRTLEQEANALTRELGTLADENTMDRLLLSELHEALSQEAEPAFTDLERLYEEAGVVLPNTTLRRFDEVRRFHESIIANRRSYLGNEVTEANARIRIRDQRMSVINTRLATIMALLQSHGALDQFTKLQSELAAQEAKTELLRQRFAAAERLESERNELVSERNQLEVRLRQDYHEQSEVLRDAILTFGKFSSALYENPGNLTISASPNGPRFDVTIGGEKSGGINSMQIFCFDMMLMQLCAERRVGPGFLVHDSHLFDGVDERQVAKALQIGAQAAHDLHFQYIVTMNSDAIPHEFSDDFDLSDYILPVRLTDANETGGLFGIRF
ncbi:MAG TPA: ABC-three component system protein [Ktedonobacteraceae bacterium]|nr:ABC-three component system protein [Ktedonobacteraceae bacterium]